MDKNPFQVLGLDVLSLSDLSLEQLGQVADRQYKSLMQIHHPDRGGSGEKARALNEAHDELTDPKRIRAWLNEVKKSRGRQYLQSKLDAAKRTSEYQQRFLFRMYAAFCITCQQGNYVDLLGIGNRRVLISRGPGEEVTNNAMQGIGQELSEEERVKVRREARQKMIESHFTTLYINDGQLLEVNSSGRVVNMSNRLLIGRITNETIISCFNGSNESIYKFLSKVCRMDQEENGRVQTLPFHYEIRTRVKTHDMVSVTTLSWPNFLRLLPYLTMNYQPSGYLFSVRIAGESLNFRLEGTITKERPKAGI